MNGDVARFGALPSPGVDSVRSIGYGGRMIRVMTLHEIRAALWAGDVYAAEVATGIPNSSLYAIRRGDAKDVTLGNAAKLTRHFMGGKSQLEIDDLPKTKQGARVFGARFYFSGKPCKHGHIAARYASSGRCVECALGH